MAANAKKLSSDAEELALETDVSSLDDAARAALRREHLSVLKEPVPNGLKALIQRIRMIESSRLD